MKTRQERKELINKLEQEIKTNEKILNNLLNICDDLQQKIDYYKYLRDKNLKELKR